jgi:hypothetical protein
LKNFSLIPTFPYYLPKIPITAVTITKELDDTAYVDELWLILTRP